MTHDKHKPACCLIFFHKWFYRELRCYHFWYCFFANLLFYREPACCLIFFQMLPFLVIVVHFGSFFYSCSNHHKAVGPLAATGHASLRQVTPGRTSAMMLQFTKEEKKKICEHYLLTCNKLKCLHRPASPCSASTARDEDELMSWAMSHAMRAILEVDVRWQKEGKPERSDEQKVHHFFQEMLEESEDMLEESEPDALIDDSENDEDLQASFEKHTAQKNTA